MRLPSITIEGGLLRLRAGWGLLRMRAEYLAWRMGWGVGLCLLLTAVAVGMDRLVLRPAENRIERLRDTATLRSRPRPAVAPRLAGDAAQIATIRSALRPLAEGPAQLQTLVAETDAVLQWQEARFTQSADVALGLTRMKIHLAAKADYPSLQTALERALLQFGNLSLDELQLKRPDRDDGSVEARLQFSLWLDGVAEGRTGKRSPQTVPGKHR